MFTAFSFLVSVSGPVEVYLKLPVSEISKIDDQRSVSNEWKAEEKKSWRLFSGSRIEKRKEPFWRIFRSRFDFKETGCLVFALKRRRKSVYQQFLEGLSVFEMYEYFAHWMHKKATRIDRNFVAIVPMDFKVKFDIHICINEENQLCLSPTAFKQLWIIFLLTVMRYKARRSPNSITLYKYFTN